MKNSILIITLGLIILTSACKAQQPISKINSDQVKTSSLVYNVKKEGEKFIFIKNSKNKLTNIAETAPNLPSDVKVRYNMILDKRIITQICAQAISLSTLKSMPMGMNDFLYIMVKVNAKGYPIEIGFGINNTSSITINEIQKIEEGIMKSAFKVTFTNSIERFFGGVNYFSIDISVAYSDMLKAKEANL